MDNKRFFKGAVADQILHELNGHYYIENINGSVSRILPATKDQTNELLKNLIPVENI